jgi:hypothetical protein
MQRRFAAQGRSEAVISWMHGGWRGLGRGLVAQRRRAREARRERGAVGELFAGCQRLALRGYLAGAATSPFRIPRYRPSSSEVTLAPWP